MIANPIMSASTAQSTAAEPETAPPTNSHDQRTDDTLQSENEAAATGTSGTMKLVVRSPYWGRILKGKTRRTFEYGGMPGRPYRVIGCQAVLSAVEGQYWGCCPHHGKRVLELKEHHFIDQFSGNWDVFAIPAVSTPHYMVHGFFMLPQNQAFIDVPFKIATEGWAFVGTANASVVRMDLEGMLAGILKENDEFGFRYHHVHLEILMDQVFDRETPRSRKAAIEKSRSERTSSNSSIGTSRSHASGGETSSIATNPPIPHVVSNDASWLTDGAAYANGNAATTSHHPETMPHGWSVEGGGLPYHQSYPPHWTNPEQAHWYRHHQAHAHGASGNIPAFLTPMNPAQQMLHQGYAVGSNTVLPPSIPTGFIAPDGVDPYSAPDQLPAPRYSPHPQSVYLQYSSYSYMSPWTTPEEDDRDDGNGAVSRTNDRHDFADEKFDDVATASISETTAEEEDDQHHGSTVNP